MTRGWAPFHYGRWLYYNSLGWSWIPGYRWAPAHVSWRYGGDYVGWAPLIPTDRAFALQLAVLVALGARAVLLPPAPPLVLLPTSYVRSHVWADHVRGSYAPRRIGHSPSAAFISARGGRVRVPRLLARRGAALGLGGVYRPSATLRRRPLRVGGYLRVVRRARWSATRPSSALAAIGRRPCAPPRRSARQARRTVWARRTARPPTVRARRTAQRGCTARRETIAPRPRPVRRRRTTGRPRCAATRRRRGYRSGAQSYRPSQPMQSRAYRAPTAAGSKPTWPRAAGTARRAEPLRRRRAVEAPC